MQSIISEITSSWPHTHPSTCINILNPLLRTEKGRTFLSKQKGENASVLIDVFDWVTTSHNPHRFPDTRTEYVVVQALKSCGFPLNKGHVLWTLRQLCACQGTLPKSCVLQVEFKPAGPHHAAGGFADVWKGSYNGMEVAFKSIRENVQGGDHAVRLKRMVRLSVIPLIRRPGDTPSLS